MQLWLLAVAVAMVLGAGGIVWWATSGEDPVPPDPFAVHHGTDPRESAELARVEQMLAGLPAELGRGDTGSLTPHGKALAKDVSTVLPQGTVLVVDRASWRRTGTVASVLVSARRPSDAALAVFLVLLERAGDRWLISQTFPQSTANPSPMAS